MARSKILTIFFAITMSALFGQNPKGLSSDEVKGRQVRGIDFNRVTTVDAVTRILNAAHVPGGVVTVTTCGPNESYTLAPVGSTLRDALDSLVIASPQYKWYIDQGAVNLVPSNTDPTLLDVIMSDFEVDGAKSLENIIDQLLSTPEVKEGITQLRLSQAATQIGIAALKRPGSGGTEEIKGFTFHMQKITVREALNAVSRLHGSAVWSYQEKRCNGENDFSISFLVQ